MKKSVPGLKLEIKFFLHIFLNNDCNQIIVKNSKLKINKVSFEINNNLVM